MFHVKQPTEAQKEAGNYKKGHMTFQGLHVTIENPKGSRRSGKSSNGREWSVLMPAHYGYIKQTEGRDGDHVDVYIGPMRESDQVFVVNQNDLGTGKFDEHKCMLGYANERDAIKDYCSGFSDGKGKDRIRSVERMSMDAFKRWLTKGNTMRYLTTDAALEHALAISRAVRRI